ncbi:hypothetical protein ABFA07_017139 [Porites harrisoni]
MLLGHCMIVAKKVAAQKGIDQEGYRVVINNGQHGCQLSHPFTCFRRAKAQVPSRMTRRDTTRLLTGGHFRRLACQHSCCFKDCNEEMPFWTRAKYLCCPLIFKRQRLKY